jgi:hypothetical protein
MLHNHMSLCVDPIHNDTSTLVHCSGGPLKNQKVREFVLGFRVRALTKGDAPQIFDQNIDKFLLHFLFYPCFFFPLSHKTSSSFETMSLKGEKKRTAGVEDRILSRSFLLHSGGIASSLERTNSVCSHHSFHPFMTHS